MQKLSVYCYFFEDYEEIFLHIYQALSGKCKNVHFNGFAGRRKTALKKFKNHPYINHTLEWLGDLEYQWLSTPISPDSYQKWENQLGKDILRLLKTCDRHLGHKYIRHALHPTSPLSRLINKKPEYEDRYIVNMLNYFNDQFHRLKPDFLLFAEFTMAYDLAAFHIARLHDIPAFTFLHSRFGDQMTVEPNYLNRFSTVDHAFQSKAQPSNQALKAAKAWLENHQNSPKIPDYSKEFKRKLAKQHTLKALIQETLRALARFSAIRLGLNGTVGDLRVEDGVARIAKPLRAYQYLEKNTGRWTDPENIPEKYLFYPLHVEPESSLYVLGYPHTDQLEIIKQISKRLPPDTQLVIKEHIPMIGIRPDSFYEEIEKLSNTIFISPYLKNLKIIQNALATVTVSGTVGWEALLMGQRVIIFGQCQYLSLNAGILKISRFSDLDDLPNKIKQLSPPTNDQLLQYIALTFTYCTTLPYKVFGYRHFSGIEKPAFENYKAAFQDLAEQLLQKSNIHSPSL